MAKDETTSTKQAPKRNALGQLEPGSTANPNGRPPKNTSYAERIRKAMTRKAKHFVDADKIKDKERLEIEVKDMIIEEQIKSALNGDRYSVAWLANREEGMPKEHIKHEGAVPVEFTGDNPQEYINSKIDE